MNLSPEPIVPLNGTYIPIRQALRCLGKTNVNTKKQWSDLAASTQRRYKSLLTVSLVTSNSEISSQSDSDAPAASANIEFAEAPRITSNYPRDSNGHSDSDSDSDDDDAPNAVYIPSDQEVQYDRPIFAEDVDHSEAMDTSEQRAPVVTGENLNTARPNNAQQPEFTGDNRHEANPLPGHEFFSYPFLVILRLWAIKHQVPGTVMEDLMKLLRKNNTYHEFASLPKSWKTVVKLNKDQRTQYEVEEWGTAEQRARYAYVGIETRLNQCRSLYISDGKLFVRVLYGTRPSWTEMMI
jgi:hypothetical protein